MYLSTVSVPRAARGQEQEKEEHRQQHAKEHSEQEGRRAYPTTDALRRRRDSFQQTNTSKMTRTVVQVHHMSPEKLENHSATTQFLAAEALSRASSLLFDARGDKLPKKSSKATDDVTSETKKNTPQVRLGHLLLRGHVSMTEALEVQACSTHRTTSTI